MYSWRYVTRQVRGGPFNPGFLENGSMKNSETFRPYLLIILKSTTPVVLLIDNTLDTKYSSKEKKTKGGKLCQVEIDTLFAHIQTYRLNYISLTKKKSIFVRSKL
jgi:hypothetical protein